MPKEARYSFLGNPPVGTKQKKGPEERRKQQTPLFSAMAVFIKGRNYFETA